jgi:hypothetical protein
MLPEQLTGIPGATAPQRCELFLNYFIVRLTGCRSEWRFLLFTVTVMVKPNT